MKKSIRTPLNGLRASRWWAWVSLVPFLAGGCKSREPRELVCEPIALFEVLEPEQGAGVAPFSIERLGPEVKMEALERRPAYVTFMDDNRASIEWLSFGMLTYGDVIYSPSEGLARRLKSPEIVYPMKRFFDGKSERVRLGFRSTACREPDRTGGYYFCKQSEDKLFLVADMTCRWEPATEPSRPWGE